MRLNTQIMTLVFAALSFAACDSDSAAEVACKKAQSCGLFEKDQTLDECVSEVAEDIPEAKLEACADCMDEHSCSEIEDDACEDVCDD